MRIWLKTSVNSSLFPWIAGSAWVASSAEYCRLMWDAAMASEGCLVGIQRERRDLQGSKVMWEGGEKRCLWSLSKWGAFARLGRGGENEWEASCEADRHSCRWIIWQQGRVFHHCRIHVHHLLPPRCKSVDSIQPLVLLDRTKADVKRCFKDKTESPVIALLCFQELLWDVWVVSHLLGMADAALTLQTTSVCGTVRKLALWTLGCTMAGRSHRQRDRIYCCESICHWGNRKDYRYKHTLDYKFKNMGGGL